MVAKAKLIRGLRAPVQRRNPPPGTWVVAVSGHHMPLFSMDMAGLAVQCSGVLCQGELALVVAQADIAFMNSSKARRCLLLTLTGELGWCRAEDVRSATA